MGNKKRDKALVTGASGMLGGYVCGALQEDFEVETLGRRDTSTYRCDLLTTVPDFKGERFRLVVHCAGTEEDSMAALNTDGTRHLLEALEANPPEYMVYVSSFRVYGKEGESLTEDAFLSPQGEAALAKEKGEREVMRWAADHGVTLTVVRPARMFGSRVGGETLRMFNDALSGFLIHIRGNEARVSVVTALDVANAIARLHKIGGTYNLADGRNPKFVEMTEAMTANAGREKRPVTLPAPWASWIWRLLRWIPAIDRNLNPEVAAQRMTTLTLDGSRAAAAAGIDYHDTIEVVAHRDATYPYEES